MLSTPDKMPWPEHETLCLISIWGEDSIQAQIEGCTRNKEVYDKVAEQMREEGYARTGVQCRDKVKKLKQDYRKIKDNNNESGRARRSTKIFEAMDLILGHRPATCPPILIDTLSGHQDADSDHDFDHAGSVDDSADFDREDFTSANTSSSAEVPVDESHAASSQGKSAMGTKRKRELVRSLARIKPGP